MAAAESGTLTGFILFLRRHRLLVFGLPGLVTLATIVYVLVVPVRYTASATLLPESGSGGGLIQAALSLAGGGLSGLSIPGLSSTESVIQEAVIKSERVADRVREEFQLDQVWKTKSRDRYLRKWYSVLKTSTNREGLLMVGVEDRDPERAVAIVERIVDLLDEINRDIRITSGRRSRIFLEQRVEEMKARLSSLEDSLVAFQSQNAGIALSPSSESVIDAGASLLYSRLRLEADLTVLRETRGVNSPDLRAKRLEIDALDAELAGLPKLNSELGTLIREIQVYQRTYAFLLAQLEEARIEEARTTRTIDVLDRPQLPTVKSWPKRTITVAMALFVSGLLSLGAARLWDAWQESQRILKRSHG